MRPIILAWIIVLLAGVNKLNAQQVFSYCQDTTRIANEFQPCGVEYKPVCGCDGKTYRNECAAFFWGGLFSGSWTAPNSSCTNFHVDFYPTAVSYFPGQLNIFMKEKGAATMYIYDAFGRLKNTDIFYAAAPGDIIHREISVQNLDLGIYNLIVVVGDEVQYVKFAKVTKFEN